MKTTTEDGTTVAISSGEDNQFNDESGVEIAEETMLGDLMKVALDEIKAAPDVWEKLSEKQQDDVIYRVEMRCRKAVRTAADLINSNGRTHVRAKVDYVKFKDGEAVAVFKGFGLGFHTIAEARDAVLIILPEELPSMEAPHGHAHDDKQADLPLQDAA